jgi:hypothetical protein
MSLPDSVEGLSPKPASATVALYLSIPLGLQGGDGRRFIGHAQIRSSWLREDGRDILTSPLTADGEQCVKLRELPSESCQSLAIAPLKSVPDPRTAPKTGPTAQNIQSPVPGRVLQRSARYPYVKRSDHPICPAGKSAVRLPSRHSGLAPFTFGTSRQTDPL